MGERDPLSFTFSLGGREKEREKLKWKITVWYLEMVIFQPRESVTRVKNAFRTTSRYKTIVSHFNLNLAIVKYSV